MRRLGVLVLGVVLITARSASAQDASRGEFSGGWRYYHATLSPNRGINSHDHPKGWYADAAFNISPKIAIVGDVGGSYHNQDFSSAVNGFVATTTSEARFYTFMGGVRLRAPQEPRFVPFGDVLFGREHDASTNEATLTVNQQTTRSHRESSSSSAALAFDGGATLMLGRIGVRASAGYVRFFPTADFEVDINAFRFNVGAAFRF